MGLAVALLIALVLGISVPIGLALFTIGLVLAILYKKNRKVGIISGVILIITSILVVVIPIIYVISCALSYTP